VNLNDDRGIDRRRTLLGVTAAIAIGVLSFGGAYLGIHLPAWLNGDLQATRTALTDTQRELDRANVRIEELTEIRTADRAALANLSTELGEKERELGNLQSALALSGPLSEQYSRMTDELSTLKADYSNLRTNYEELVRSMEPLVAIRTPELSGDAIYLDRSISGITYTGAVCSGSMEPNITCNDLLVLYPPKITDLGVGDIIYFRRQAPGCTGPLEDRFILHRIVQVTAGPEGLAFRTQGDAVNVVDACPVPASDVLYKLLTNIRNGRVDS